MVQARRFRLGWLALVLCSCQGLIGDTTDEGAESSSPPGEPDGSKGTPGSGPVFGFDPYTPPSVAGPACGGKPLDPGPAFLRRLTNLEYRQTARDLLGVSGDPSTGFPADVAQNGFDNNAESVTISSYHLESYRDAAEQLAGQALSSATSRASVVGCALDGGDAVARATCLRSFVTSFGRRAWRRPLAKEEGDALVALAATASGNPGPYAGASLVIQAALLSPHFLFRVEVGQTDPARPGMRKLTGHEVATRLSYLLRGTMPDEALMAAAEQGQLDTAAKVVATATEMFKDPRARVQTRNFFGQWLQMPQLATVERDRVRYPMWTPALGDAMREETSRFVEDAIWRDGVSFLDVYTAPFTFLNTTAAKVYGKMATATWTRVPFTAVDQRGGLLTQPSILTATADQESTLPILRGKFIREALLCQELPPVPAEVPPLPKAVAGESDRKRLERHRSNPACGACHAMMDPLGFGLSRYDMIGALRTVDSNKQPVTGEGSLSGFGASEFDGAVELGRLLHDSPRAAECVVTELFRYTHARKEVEVDQCEVEQVLAAFKQSGHSFRAMLLAFVRSDGFRYRRANEL